MSTWVVGGVVWAGGAAGLYTQLTLPEALLYGAIVSATDPVSCGGTEQEGAAWQCPLPG